MKIFNGSEYVKLVPKKFEPIKKRILKLVDTSKKRLSNDERMYLERELFKYQLEQDEPMIYDLVKDMEFLGCRKIRCNNKENTIIFMVVYTKSGRNIEVKCSKGQAEGMAGCMNDLEPTNRAKQLNLINHEQN